MADVNHDRERLLRHVSVAPDGCWIWTGNRYPSGYGQAWFDGKNVGAHRATYLVLVGEIPDGMELDHLCRNRSCCNPRHLEPVTSSENKRRSPLVGRAWQQAGAAAAAVARRTATHCKNGHLRSEHTYINAHDLLVCRRCRQAIRRQNRERRAA